MSANGSSKLLVAAAVCFGFGCSSSSNSHFSTPVTITGPSVAADGSLDRVPLSVWGDSASSVFFVGGGVGVVSGGSPVPGLFMHWDGKNFVELGPKVTPTLWWVTGFSATDVWAVGEQGTVVHYDGSALTTVSTGVNATLAGIWGSSSSNLWAVGGSLSGGGGDNDVILHCTGSCTTAASWQKVTPPMVTGQAYFKIWGSDDHNIVLVGLGGVIEHYDGTSWSIDTVPVTAPLLTVNGKSANDIYVVGGPPGTLLHSTDGKTWTQDTSQTFPTGLTGVFAHSNGDLFVVGLNGQKYWRKGGTWNDYTNVDPPSADLHSIWIDSSGQNGFAVGGNYTTPATAVARRNGIVTRIGSSIPAATLSGP
jgi:hypothetical protein